jgi:hypothetical protein
MRGHRGTATDVLELVLALGASARLARLVRIDTIWAETVGGAFDAHVERHESARRVAKYYDETTRPNPADQHSKALADYRHPAWLCEKVQEMTTCPHCLGFWTSLLTVGTVVLTRWTGRPFLRDLWRAGAAVLATSYVVGHTSAVLDRYAED